MKLFRVILDDNTDDYSTNYGCRDYYVVENCIDKAVELISIVESREPNGSDSQVEVQYCYYGKKQIKANDVVKNKPSGYFRTKHLVDVTMFSGTSYCSIVLPFIPFSIRKSFIDSFIKDLC